MVFELPPVPQGRFTWVRAKSYGWVESVLQDRISLFALAFDEEHTWMRQGSMVITESFTDTGVNVSVPLGPTGPPQRKDNFMQRTGVPLVKLSVLRDRDARQFEIVLSFPLGNDQPMANVENQLGAARESLRAAELATR